MGISCGHPQLRGTHKVNLHPVVKKICIHVEMRGPCRPRQQVERNIIVNYHIVLGLGDKLCRITYGLSGAAVLIHSGADPTQLDEG